MPRLGLGKSVVSEGGGTSPILLQSPTGVGINSPSVGQVDITWTDPALVPYFVFVSLFDIVGPTLITSTTIISGIQIASLSAPSGATVYGEVYNSSNGDTNYVSSGTISSATTVVA